MLRCSVLIHCLQARLWYYQVFTPMKLLKAACQFVHHEHSVTATKLTFADASENDARLVQIPLMPPGNHWFWQSHAKIVVKMSIGTVTDMVTRESDPSYAISDGRHFIGAIIRDKNNFNAGFRVVEAFRPSLSIRREGLWPCWRCLSGGKLTLFLWIVISAGKWSSNTSWIQLMACCWRFTSMTNQRK